MSDLIDRQAAIGALNKMKIYRPLDSDRYVISDCLNKIVNLPSAQQWIPCSERLPEYGKNVLITNSKGNVSYGRFRGVEFWKEDGDNYWTWKKNTIEHVLAWMPLPEPYKGEGNETD